MAIVGGGSFWVLEAIFRKIPGVKEVKAGYCGGETEDPTYEDVCDTEKKGHSECVQIWYNPLEIEYVTIMKIFFMAHDPTQVDPEGEDMENYQYRSIVLT